MERAHRAWWLRQLDDSLSVAWRGLAPEELSRLRVVLGATCLLVLLDLAYLGFLPGYLPSQRLSQAVVLEGNLISCLGVLVLLRRQSTSLVPSMILCGTLTASILLATLAVEVPGGVTHMASMLVPLLAVYLVGARRGFIFTALFALNAAIVYELVHSDFGRARPLFVQPHVSGANLMASLSLLLGWALSWLYSVTREESQQGLRDALQTLRESEGKLKSLIESTDDVVVSLDGAGRLLLANPVAQRLFGQLTGGRTLVFGRLLEEQCPEDLREWLRVLNRSALRGECVRSEVDLRVEGTPRTLEVLFNPVRAGERVVGITLFGRDLTERKRAELQLAELHRGLLDVSRQAGMAEIATGVLHNVGNTLNSVNVSASLVVERLRDSRVSGLGRAAALLRDNASGLDTFLTRDPRGQRLPDYLEALWQQLSQERETMLEEMSRLGQSVDHIKSVVSMQQRHARVHGQVEQVSLPGLLEDALRLHAVSFERSGIVLRREYTPAMPAVWVDRHKLLQILVNLLSNAHHALLEAKGDHRQLILRVEQAGERLRISVRDTGVGIAPEHVSRLFSQGFTTKKDGHGFGLHASALAARELGGELSCASEGLARGAVFTLELPVTGAPPPREAAPAS